MRENLSAPARTALRPALALALVLAGTLALAPAAAYAKDPALVDPVLREALHIVKDMVDMP